ncbi:MAG: hypothetical protein ABJB34_06355 [Acidobacteriota bacterium]
MDYTNKLGTEELTMQSLLEAFLLSRSSLKSSAAETSFHVDEDFLAAFTEGNLGERESMPVVSHLVDCGFCRQKTAELVRLGIAFETGEDEIRPMSSAEPHKISEVLSGILSKIFGTAEGAVFAHNEEDAGDKATEETVETNEDK